MALASPTYGESWGQADHSSTPAHLDKLIRLLPNIRLAITLVTESPDLPLRWSFFAGIIGGFRAGLNRSIPFAGIAESAFALSYLHTLLHTSCFIYIPNSDYLRFRR